MNTLSLSLSPYRQHKRDAMLARILDTAREIMRAEGVAALSMQELARRLDMRAPSLYHYFSNKMDVFDALFRLGFTLFEQHTAVPQPSDLPWQVQIRQAVERYLSFAIENPELYQLCFERPVPGFVPSEASLQYSFSILQQAYAQMDNLLPHIETNLSAQQATDLIIAVTHGITALHLANEPHLPAGEGRFGSLIPAVMTVLEKAWSKP